MMFKKLTPIISLILISLFTFSSCGGGGSESDPNVNEPVTGIYLKSLTSLFINGTEQLSVTITPSNATNQSVIWSSNDTDVVIVSSSGFITGISAGTSTITAKTEDGNYQAQCHVTVSPIPVSVSGVSLNKNSTGIYINSTEQLTATVLPVDATNQNVTWSSGNANIITVSANGLIKGITAGNSTVTVTTEDGNYHSECEVTVLNRPVSGVNINKTSLTLFINGTESLTAEILPSNATNKNVTWSSSNPGAVTVTSNGFVKGIALGNAAISVTTEDGGFLKECVVSVTEIPVSSVSLNKNSSSIYINSTEQLTATVLPSGAANKNVTWSSSNESVATVSTSGLVTGISAGFSNIRVTTVDGGFYKECIFSVSNRPVTNVTLDKYSVKTYIGGTEQLNASILPSNATNKNLTWSSNNTDIVTVSTTGFVTAIANGQATVTATTEDGGFYKNCTVNVYKPFISTWKTNASGNNIWRTIVLPLASMPNGSYDFYVEWGDGTKNHITQDYQSETTHFYSAEGTYDIKIYGIINGFGFSSSKKSNPNLIDVKQWGDVKFHNQGNQFRDTINLIGFSASDIPDTSNISSMSFMFYNSVLFNHNINTWNISNVTNMAYMFYKASSFNQDLNSWNVSKVIYMSNMFEEASAFNGNISSWNVGEVKEMGSMFYKATSFNKDLGSWNVSNVYDMRNMFNGATVFNGNIGSWDVSKLVLMTYMFNNAKAFNSDISSWNVSHVTYMNSLFSGASAFNRDIGSWNVSEVKEMSFMFYNASLFNCNLESWDVGSVTGVTGMTMMFTGSGLAGSEPSWYPKP